MADKENANDACLLKRDIFCTRVNELQEIKGKLSLFFLPCMIFLIWLNHTQTT